MFWNKSINETIPFSPGKYRIFFEKCEIDIYVSHFRVRKGVLFAFDEAGDCIGVWTSFQSFFKISEKRNHP